MNADRPWYREPETFIAVAALVVSVSAVAVGLYEARLQRTHDRAEVWPHVEISTFVTPTGASLSVDNTGLGPAIIKSVVVTVDGKARSNWYIWAYSELGHGTTFKIYLPRVADTPEKGALPTPATLAVGSETVLVVEDQSEVRELTTRILEARGYTVLAAENGGDAMQLAEHYLKRIDLLLTDVVMPGVNGRELALRLGAQRRDIKVLFVSGYTGEAIRRHGLLELGAAFLQKPFSPDSLARKVRDVLDAAEPN
jgi:two-component system, cell cycle sensor histidine kinase and response regulator CckA